MAITASQLKKAFKHNCKPALPKKEQSQLDAAIQKARQKVAPFIKRISDTESITEHDLNFTINVSE